MGASKARAVSRIDFDSATVVFEDDSKIKCISRADLSTVKMVDLWSIHGFIGGAQLESATPSKNDLIDEIIRTLSNNPEFDSRGFGTGEDDDDLGGGDDNGHGEGGQGVDDSDSTDSDDGDCDDDESDSDGDSDGDSDSESESEEEQRELSPIESQIKDMIDEFGSDNELDEDRVREIAREEDDVLESKLMSDVESLIEERVANPIQLIINDVEMDSFEDAHHPILETVIKIVSTDQHVFLVGPAGSGKSTIAGQASKLLGRPFEAMSVGPMDTPSKIFGFVDANGNYHASALRRMFEAGGVLCLDEVDNGNASINTSMNALLDGMTDGQFTFPDGTVKVGEGFVVVATANTFGRGADRQYVGRQTQDSAFLDRFVQLEMDYCEELETSISMAFSNDEISVDATRWLQLVRHVRRATQERKINQIISPRASIKGVKLLRAGIALDELPSMILFNGMSAEAIEGVQDLVNQYEEV